MANKDKATHDQPGLENRREITNTGGRLDEDPSVERPAEGERTAGEHPTSVGKSGDDAWHRDSNRSSEKGEGAEPMRGGNQPHPADE